MTNDFTPQWQCNEAPQQPAKWAQALLAQRTHLAMHGKIGEVAHELAHVAAVAEASHAPFLSRLF